MKNVEKVYNKLILIGNGFDLALDLKTSYNDFLFWLLKSEVLKALESFPQKVTNEKHTKYNDFLRQYDLISFYGFASNPLSLNLKQMFQAVSLSSVSLITMAFNKPFPLTRVTVSVVSMYLLISDLK